MAWTVTYHKPLLQRVTDDDQMAWTGIDLLVVLWSEEATVAPAADDEVLTALSPDTNELVAVGYSRATVDGAFAWSTPNLELLADNAEWTAVESEHTGHAVSGFTVCQKIGDGTTNASQVLLVSMLTDTPVELTGGDLAVAFDGGVLASLGPAA